jgi:hypothetical protein
VSPPPAQYDRTCLWQAAVPGFKLPSGLEPCPVELVEAQTGYCQAQDIRIPVDVFEYPIELVWGRLLPVFHAEPLAHQAVAGLRRAYDGAAYFWEMWRPLRDHLELLPDGKVEVVVPEIRPTLERALTGAAVIYGVSTIERTLDLAERASRVYLGLADRESLPPKKQGKPVWGRDACRQTIADLAQHPDLPALCSAVGADGRAVPVETVRVATEALAEDPYDVTAKIYGGLVTTEAVADDLRHMWAHGKDQDFSYINRETLVVLASVMDQYLNSTLWLLMGTPLGAACKEWADALSSRTGG